MAESIYIHTEDIHNFSAAREILPVVIELFNPRSLLDVGCGTGTWLAVAKELGIEDIVGVDGDFVDRQLLKIPEEVFIGQDLNKPIDLKRKFDAVLCLEVAEHLSSASAGIIVESLTRHSDIIIFSAAIPQQGGQNHINEQWATYWESIFNSKGFVAFDMLRMPFWNNSNIEWWYKQNMVVYAKEGSGLLHNTPQHKLVNLVHPELYTIKTLTITALQDQIDQLNKKLSDPYFFPAFRRMIRALVKCKF